MPKMNRGEFAKYMAIEFDQDHSKYKRELAQRNIDALRKNKLVTKIAARENCNRFTALGQAMIEAARKIRS